MLDPRTLLAKLDFTDAEVDVYLAMLGGALSAREIVQSTGRSRPTVYYSLSALERRGLVSKTGLENEGRLRVEPLQRLKAIVDQRQEELANVEASIQDFARQFRGRKTGDNKPQVAFYEGLAGIRNVIMDTIYCHGKQIDTIVPKENFFCQLGPDFVEHYVEQRQSRRIVTRNLWATTIEEKIIKQFYDRAEIRMMPGKLGEQFESTVFMYDDQVLYISSLASGYALLVRSEEHFHLMQTLYGVIWEASKPLKS
jgi:sugar-specific transcriptional regulator TrmB